MPMSLNFNAVRTASIAFIASLHPKLHNAKAQRTGPPGDRNWDILQSSGRLGNLEKPLVAGTANGSAASFRLLGRHQAPVWLTTGGGRGTSPRSSLPGRAGPQGHPPATGAASAK